MKQIKTTPKIDNTKKVMVIAITLIVIGILILAIISNEMFSVPEIFISNKGLENVNNVMQIIAALIIIIGGIVAVWQYTLTSRSERYNRKMDRIQKAIEMAEHYKDGVLINAGILNNIYTKSGLNEAFKKIYEQNIYCFDEKELKEILSSDEIKNINDIKNSEIYVNTIKEVFAMYGIANYNTNDTDDIYKERVERIAKKTLNDLEYFSMFFTHKIADESVVYLSLHQTFVELVKSLYFHIASRNNNSARPYYTKIQELYRIWDGKMKEDDKKMNTATTEALKSSRGSILDDDV